MLDQLSYLRSKKYLYISILSLPIVLIYSFALMHNLTAVSWGDSDFFFAMSEAFRKSVVEYHQFPWWNPWVSGGLPLYADPQFGLFSIQSFFILVFGTVIGWKLAILTYVVLAFYGFRLLATSIFKTPEFSAVLLAYTWVFSIFWAFRTSAGHLSFLTLAFLPWILYFYWNRRQAPLSWVGLGISIALAVNSAPHNTTIMSLAILALIVAIDLLIGTLAKNRKQARDICWFLCKTAFIVIPLTIHKLYFTYAYAASNSVSRTNDHEEFIGFNNLLNALFNNHVVNGVLPAGWGKPEALMGLGWGVLLAICFTLIIKFPVIRQISLKSMGKLFKNKESSFFIMLFILFLITLFLSFGDRPPFFYTVMRELPIFRNTRVAARWVILTGTLLLLMLATIKMSKRNRIIFNALLMINLVFLCGNSFKILENSFYLPVATGLSKNQSLVPESTVKWNAPRSPAVPLDDNLYTATINNVDQLRTNLTPFFDTKNGTTKRCDEALSSCSFVTTKNADILLWTPNKIIIRRTGAGPILLNMNPSRYWTVNKKYVFSGQSLSSPTSDFQILDQSPIDVLIYSPPGTSLWLRSKFD